MKFYPMSHRRRVLRARQARRRKWLAVAAGVVLFTLFDISLRFGG